MKIKKANPFLSERYNDLGRFISYYYQVKLIRKLQPETLLEIGIGSGLVSSYFKRAGIKVTTCDIDSNLCPNVVGDIRSLPIKDRSYDAVAAFEILEHIPFSDLDIALLEISRVSKKNVIISLPYRHTCFEMVLKLPFSRSIFKKPFFCS